ncbi:unnamed protein product [Bursaphelenchus xylophilus]|uniref:(pine wood nematode) hypothetical protein n=1 Tax=Bursaphelenchus xylophilus TaxID=6326 RepID=A0A1I7S2I7_BURXY|nr:unnamed protein product [Bursaphelenchus xylophilus]CAG9121928.1 unnamed protein product [Bursaphelenchus xylophilus]
MGQLRWCDYMAAIGQRTEECEPDSKSLEIQRQVEMKIPYPDYNLCTGHYGYCYASEECESGTVCKQTFTERKCCTSPYSQCPSVDELGYTCLKHHPTNWCLRDDDCDPARTNRYLCCPTGCNYNVCVRSRGYRPNQLAQQISIMQAANNGLGRLDEPGFLVYPILKRKDPLIIPHKPPTWQQNSIVWNYEKERELARKRHKHLLLQLTLNFCPPLGVVRVPSTCPSALSLAVTCQRHYSRRRWRPTTSWCSTHDDCRPSRHGDRSCCSTPCGYSLCVTKLSGGTWFIG